jgi:hypothetical protein
VDEALDPLPLMSAAEQGVWVVWRQDDHDNRAEVARHAERSDAYVQASELEARGHKQTYWVQALGASRVDVKRGSDIRERRVAAAGELEAVERGHVVSC